MLIDEASSGAAIAGGRAATDEAKLQDDLNRFLTLLVTQLQHQDPLDPMDANEFTQQLVQFASVEQQIYQNANLEKLVAVQRSGQSAAMVGYLGRLAEINGNALPLADGFAEASYTLSQNAATTAIAIKDPSGRAVFTSAGATDAGRHAFTWDGRDASGHALADGAYTLEVIATGKDGAVIPVDQTVYGRVTGTAPTADSVQLLLGDVAVDVEDVLSVREGPPPRPATDD